MSDDDTDERRATLARLRTEEARAMEGARLPDGTRVRPLHEFSMEIMVLDGGFGPVVEVMVMKLKTEDGFQAYAFRLKDAAKMRDLMAGVIQQHADGLKVRN